MSRRIVILLLITTTLIAAAALLPGTPAGRSWLLARGVGLVQNIGYELRYDRHRGNLWSGVLLEGVELTGPGLDVQLARLDIGYFLPSLLTGELPLAVAIETVRGRIDLDAFETGGAGGSPLRITLRELALDDIAVDIDDAPFTLPDLGLEGLSAAAGRSGGIEVSGTVVSSEGRAPFDGEVTLAPFGFDLAVRGADLTLARHWWSGVRGGTVDAAVMYGTDGIQVDAEVQGGAVELIGLRFSDLAGPVRFRGLELEANLEGRGLSGPVAADGTVDIAARRWQANYRASPRTAEAAAWLSPAVAATLADLGIEAALEVSGTVGGWTEVGSEGVVSLAGSFLGEPIEDGSARYSFGSAEGVQVDGSARWAGGAVSARIETADGFDLSADAAGVTLTRAGVTVGGSGAIEYSRGASGASASYRAQLSGEAIGRALQLQIDGTLDGDGWQAFVTGSDDRGASAEGAVVLAADGIEAGLTLSGVELPVLPQPLSLELSASGPLERLDIGIELLAPESLRLALGPAAAVVDARGSVDTVLVGGRPGEVRGSLGPLDFAGTLDLAEDRLQLDYTLEPIRIDSDIAGNEFAVELSVTEGSFGWDGGDYRHRARIDTAPLQLGPIGSEGLSGEVRGASGEAWTFAGDGGDLGASLAGGQRLALEFDAFPLLLAGRRLELSGAAAAELASLPAGLVAELDLSLDGLELALQAAAGQATLAGELPAGTVGPQRSALALAGRIDLDTLEAQLSATSGEVRLDLAGPLTPEPVLAGRLLSAGREARVTAEPLALDWTLRGDIGLEALSLLGIDAAGSLGGEIGGRGAAVQGELSGRIERPLPAQLTVTADGGSVSVQADTDLAGVEVALAGQVWPERALTARLANYGTVALDGSLLSGSGELPGAQLGPLALPGQSWQLDGTLEPPQATVRAGASLLQGSWQNGWALSGRIEQTLLLAGEEMLLEGTADFDRERPFGRIEGRALLPGGDSVEFEGSLEQLDFKGSLPAALASELAGAPLVPAGSLELSGRLAPLAGPTLSLEGAWRGEDFDLAIEGAVGGGEFAVSARGDGIALRIDPDGVAAEFDRTELAPFLIEPEIDALASGNLALNGDGDWGGEMTLGLRRPLVAEVVLRGVDGALSAEASFSDARVQAQVSGQLLPELALTVDADLLAGRGRLIARASGTPNDPLVTGTLTTAGQTFVELIDVPALAAEVHFDADEGRVTLNGEGIALRGDLESLAGRLDLGVIVAGRPHLFEIELGGSPLAPNGWLQISGPLATGSVLFDGERASVDLSLDPELLPLPGDSGVDLGRVRISGSSDLAGRWQGDVTAPLSYLGLDASLQASATGERLAYRGDLLVSDADGAPLLAAGVSGSAAAAEIVVDLASVDVARSARLFGIPLEGDATGTVRLGTAPFDYRLDGSVRGETDGVPFELAAQADSAGAIDLTLGAFGVELQASGSTRQAQLEVAGRGLDLSGSIELAERVGLELNGTAAGVPLRARLDYHAGTESGSLGATVAGVVIDSDLRGPLAGLTASGSAATESLPGLGGAAAGSFTLRRDGGALTVSVDAEAAGALPLRLQLAGELLPDTRLAGSIDLAGDIGVLGLEAAGRDGGGYALRLNRSDLQLSALLGSGFALREIALTGSGQLPLAGRTLGIDSAEMQWRPEGGFGGRLELTGAAFGLEGRARVAGDGDGDIVAEVELLRGDRLADGTIRLSSRPWSDRTLSGSLNYRLEPDHVTGAALPEGIALAGEIALSGSWSDPELQAEAQLSGPVPAAGSWRYRGGSGSVALSGAGFVLDAEADGGGYRGHLDIDGYPLGETIPLLAAPQLSGSAEISGDWDGPLQAVLPVVVLASGDSRIESRATLQIGPGGSSYAAVARLDVDLADLLLDTPLRGRVRGPLAISGEGSDLGGAGLSGMLALTRLGPRDALPGSGLSGTLQLSGSAADPLLGLHLDGDGEASGSLRGEVRPLALEASLDSDLSFGPLSSDLRVSLGGGAVSASGEVSYRDLRATIAPAGDRLLVFGEERLAGLRGSIDPAARSARFEAPLQILSSAVGGSATVELALPGGSDGAPWLAASVAGLTVSGIEIGEVGVVWQLPGGEIRLDGVLQGTIDPAADLAWTARLAEVAPVPGVTLSASGSGAGLRGEIAVLLGGDFAGRPLRLPLDIGLDGGGTIAGSGEALGGEVTLSARVSDEAGWQGSVALANATVGPETLSLKGALSGPPGQPRLELDASATGPAPGTAHIVASRGGVQIEARVEPPGAADRLELNGEIWPVLDVSLGIDGGGKRLQLSSDGAGPAAPLTVTGGVQTTIGPLRLALRGEAGDLVAEVRPTAALELPGLALASEPLSGTPAEIVRRIAGGSLVFHGSDATGGRVALQLGSLSAAITDLSYRGDGFAVTLSGEAGLRSPTRIVGVLDLSGAGTSVPGVPSAASLPFELAGGGDDWSLLIEGERGRLEAALQPSARSGRLQGRLGIGDGSISADLALASQEASGHIELDRVRLVGVPGLAGFELSGRVDALGDHLAGNFDLDALAGRGGADLEGSYPLAELWGGAPGLDPLTLTARIRTFDVTSLPPLAARAPFLTGAISGVAQLRRGQLVGRLVAPDLAVIDTALPSEVEFNGGVQRLDVRANVAGSPLTGSLSPDSVSALLRFERFPLQVLAEAVAGGTDIGAEVTGAARVELPLATPGAIEVRIATELIRLERDGVVTSGNATIDYHEGALTVQDVTFEGAGRWQATGVVRSDRLDLSVSAEGADFGPLLGLIPALARLEVGASGDLTLVASGSLARPAVALDSEQLSLELAGTRYRLEGTRLTLDGSRLAARSEVIGVSPIVGRMEVQGGGMLSLAPLRLGEALFEIDGAATVPILGDVTELVGTVRAGDGEPPRLEAGGTVGNRFALEGTLLPLDLRLSGDALAIRAPNLLLAASEMDTDVRLRYTDALEIGGSLLAHEARFQLGIRPRGESGGGSARSALERVRFDDLQIDAPGRIFFNESFANLEARAALTLSGTAATPRLSGTAAALRGSIRFSGRDFAIERGIATFEPSRGPYPLVDLTAVTGFDKARVIPAGAQVRFVEPANSSRFEVVLRFEGALEPRSSGGFSLDFDPDLSSDARIEVEGEAALTSGPRSLTPSELLALVTLGRLDISSILAADGGLVTAVAQGALDTAVDLLVLAELQAALSEALGVEVVEIRTTALSSLIDGSNGDPFGVSLRLGGYLTEELFASFQIGRFDDADSAFALTNEVRLTYALGPLEFDLAGGVNFAADEDFSPIPELSTSVRYGLTPLVGIEAGLDLSSNRSLVRFGVTLRY